MSSPQEFLEFVFSKICKSPDQVDIQVEEEEGLIRFNVKVAPEDMKYVIGRK